MSSTTKSGCMSEIPLKFVVSVKYRKPYPEHKRGFAYCPKQLTLTELKTALRKAIPSNLMSINEVLLEQQRIVREAFKDIWLLDTQSLAFTTEFLVITYSLER